MSSIETYPQPTDSARVPEEASSRPPTERLGFPVPLASFVGRERQLEEVGQLLTSNRLVTLSGSGGVGKTRLALEVARRVQGQYHDGACFVSLASLSDPSLIGAVVLHALGQRENGGLPRPRSVELALRDREVLLMLDNVEHLLDAAPRMLEWLEVCPKLTVLPTSRAPLGLPGEQLYPVPPLTLPG